PPPAPTACAPPDHPLRSSAADLPPSPRNCTSATSHDARRWRNSTGRGPGIPPRRPSPVPRAAPSRSRADPPAGRPSRAPPPPASSRRTPTGWRRSSCTTRPSRPRATPSRSRGIRSAAAVPGRPSSAAGTSAATRRSRTPRPPRMAAGGSLPPRRAAPAPVAPAARRPPPHPIRLRPPSPRPPSPDRLFALGAVHPAFHTARMNDGELPSQSPLLEDTLARWDEQLATLERQAGAMLRATKRLRKAAHEGAVAAFPAAVAELHDNAAKLQTALAQTAAPEIDLPSAFADGRFLSELASAASAANVTLVQRDGR